MKIAEKNIKKAGMSKYVTMNEFDFKKAKNYHIQRLILLLLILVILGMWFRRHERC